jgi:hypothetical protein
MGFSRVGGLTLPRSGNLNLMAIFNGLIVTMFLILLAASAAVVGSMIVLALFDLVFSRKRPSATAEVIDSDSEIADSYDLEAALKQDNAANSKHKPQQLAA